MRERGQGTVEWVAVVGLVAVVLTIGAVAVDASWLPRRLACAVTAACRHQDIGLAAEYGPEVAWVVRANAPTIAYEPGVFTLPVDFRRCRSHACSDAPDRPGAFSVSARGRRATMFTRVIDRRGGGPGLFIQYWLYYPDSTYNGLLKRIGIGHHDDDWESFQLWIAPSGRALARASAHHGYAGRRRPLNADEAPDWVQRLLSRGRGDNWTPVDGLVRVSRGSHAGHLISELSAGERRTPAAGIALIAIEALTAEDRATPFAITPPWRKRVYSAPLAATT